VYSKTLTSFHSSGGRGEKGKGRGTGSGQIGLQLTPILHGEKNDWTQFISSSSIFNLKHEYASERRGRGRGKKGEPGWQNSDLFLFCPWEKIARLRGGKKKKKWVNVSDSVKGLGLGKKEEEKGNSSLILNEAD